MRGLNLTSGRSPVGSHHDHAHVHYQLGLFCISALTCGQGNPTRCDFKREVRLELRICSARGLKSEVTAQRPPMRLRLDEPANLTCGWLFTHTVF